MDGQNFQNEQDNQTAGTSDNTYTNTYTGNYQDNTQYTQSTYVEPSAAENATPGLAIASLVMGILAIVLSCCCGVGIIFAIAGIIMAIVANKQTKSGIGTAGLICSIVGAVFSVFGLIYFFAVGAAAMAEYQY